MGEASSLVRSNNVDGGREVFERAWKMRVLVASILALTAAPTSLSAGPTVSRCPFGRPRRGKFVLAQAGRGNQWETNLRNRWVSECLYPSAPTFINDFWTGTVPRARPYTCSSGGLLTIPVNGFASYFSGLPPLFPSLSPTVLALFRQPLSEQGSPRNTVSEQLVAAAVGLVCSLCIRPGRRAEHLAGGRNAPAHWLLRPRWR